ncbi:MAG: hypothetical protein A2033_03420 [Bacteroidetes bacterium GWA2_31_9]|nr:MAG: hypothetical protein A2033_03420 [Bacteroidetes bacterium GWA2_31_9]
MNEEEFREWEEIMNIVHRFEQMLENNANSFFEEDEFESLADYYLENNKLSNASKAIEYGLGIYPTSNSIKLKNVQLLIDQKEFDKAFAIIGIIEKSKSFSYEVNVLKGTIYNLKNEPDKAEIEFEKALLLIEDESVLDEILLNIAISFEVTFHYETALKYLNRAIKINPSNFEILLEMAICYERTTNNKKAIEYYIKYLDEEPFDAEAWFSLGISYSFTENYEKAIEAYDFAIAINDKFSSAYFYKADIYVNIKNDYLKGLDVYFDYLALIKDDPSVYYYIGECYENLSEFEKALDFYNKTLLIEPKYADAYLGIAYVHLELNNIDICLENVIIALEIDNENPEYWYLYAKVQSNKSNYEEAKKGFENALNIESFDEEIWIDFSDLFYTNNKIDEAIKTLNESQTYCPDSADIAYKLAFLFSKAEAFKSMYSSLENAFILDSTRFDNYKEMFSHLENDLQFIELIKKYKIK